MDIRNIRISHKPNFIILCSHTKVMFHYFLDNLNTKNKQTDKGVWKIKYKIN